MAIPNITRLLSSHPTDKARSEAEQETPDWPVSGRRAARPGASDVRPGLTTPTSVARADMAASIMRRWAVGDKGETT